MFYVSVHGWMTYKGIGGAPNSCGNYSPSLIGFLMSNVEELKSINVNGHNLTMVSLRGDDAAVYYLNLPFEEFDQHLLGALQTQAMCLDIKAETQQLRAIERDKVNLGAFGAR